MIKTFPIYLLKLDTLVITFPKYKNDISHIDFWEKSVSHIIANYYKISQKLISNLPYCQKRARICDNIIYYGEKTNKILLYQICKALNNDKLKFVYDEHEKRLKEDVEKFNSIVQSQL